MRFLLTFGVIAAGILLAGCATGKNTMTPDTAGPAPAGPGAANSTDGALMLYSDYEFNADFNSRDPRRPEYSDGKIYAADGRLLRHIHHESGTLLQDPASGELPAGNYRVEARANGYGDVTIPVVSEAGQNTVLHLEGGGSWPDPALFNQTNAVRLPDGQVVGSRAGGEHPRPFQGRQVELTGHALTRASRLAMPNVTNGSGLSRKCNNSAAGL